MTGGSWRLLDRQDCRHQRRASLAIDAAGVAKMLVGDESVAEQVA